MVRDGAELAAARQAAGLTVAVCLPAHDEAATVGAIVHAIRTELVETCDLVDDILVIDDGSTDDTAKVARAAGARVVAEADVLADEGSRRGKGNALWKSLYATDADIVCWIDADLRNFRAEFVSELVAPLITDPTVMLAKAYYDRPLHGAPTGGGRVTELVARPLLSHLFPKLADIVQPLAGEYAGRRGALERLPFVEGWGVEIALLIDIANEFGRDAIAQVDLGVREHRNRPLAELGAPALAILVTALRRAGLETTGPEIAQLTGFDADHQAVVHDVPVGERPPMLTIPAYRAKFGRSLTA